MAKTAVLKVTDPAADRAQLVRRLLARRPAAKVLRYALPDGGEMTSTTERDSKPLPPASVSDWADDRIFAVLGGRMPKSDGERAYLEVASSWRSGDPDAVRAAFGRAAGGLDGMAGHRLYLALAEARAKAPSFAYEVAQAALSEASRRGWGQLPRRTRQRLRAALLEPVT
jgi:hypothetical protein